jgi:hypothetical protein
MRIALHVLFYFIAGLLLFSPIFEMQLEAPSHGMQKTGYGPCIPAPLKKSAFPSG